MLLRAILSGRVWNGFLPGQAKKEELPCRFCSKRDGDGHLFWDCTFTSPPLLPPLPPILHVWEIRGFASLMSLDRSNWPRCLLWHGWLLGLGLSGERDPWAASFGQLASWELERCLGAYPADYSGFWTPPDFWDGDDLALEMTDDDQFFGLTAAGRTIRLMGLRLLVLVCVCFLPNLLWMVLFGVLLKGNVMLDWSGVVLLCLARSRLFSVLNSGVSSLLYRRTGLVIRVLITLMLPGLLGGCWTVGA